MLRRFASTSRLPPTIRQLLQTTSLLGSNLQVNGWIQSIQHHKKVTFAVLTDGSSHEGLQVVFSHQTAERLTTGTSVSLKGELVQSRGWRQAQELQVSEVHVLGECDPVTYPIQNQALTHEYLRDNANFRARESKIAAMLRLRHSLQKMIHQHFEAQGFCYMHTPIITSNDCEGAGEAFRVSSLPTKMEAASKSEEFFSVPSFLTVSSQLHLEALATAISRVFTLSPCFRAESSQTSRHLAEFWMLEAEWAFTSSVGDICDIVEDSLKEILAAHALQGEMQVLWKGSPQGPRQALEKASKADPWVRMSYTSAVKELEGHQAATHAFQYEPKWGEPLRSEHERWLAEVLVQGPVFVTDYPASLKPFYMRLNSDEKTVACFDLLVPHVGELAGGSLREERIQVLSENLRRHNLPGEEYKWYTDLRKFGGAPHGGYGMGFERLVGWIGGIDNVRECIPMPRWKGRMLL